MKKNTSFFIVIPVETSNPTKLNFVKIIQRTLQIGRNGR
jgi:hypothetical protein